MGVDIHQTISLHFAQNIEYFEQNHPALFQKLLSFETALQEQYYTQRYNLVYENNQFEIIELSSNSAFYNYQSKLFVKTFLQSIDYSTQHNCFTLIQTDQELPTSIATFDKSIFFGAGLSIHLPSFVENYTPQVLLIVENDLELFYNSLFTVNYKLLSHNTQLFFSVFEERDDFLQTSKAFLQYKSYLNSYIKFFPMLHHDDAKISEFQLAVTTQPHRSFSYTHLFEEMLKPINNILSGYPFLDKSSSCTNEQKPFLLLAAGPSLQTHILWLQAHQHNFTIVAVSAILAYLESNNIKVDIAVHLDTLGGASTHFQKIKSWNYFQDTTLLFSSKADSDFLDKIPQKNLMLFEVGTNYLTHSLKPSSPCVGSLSYQLLLLLQVPEIYLLGLDLAIDLQTGATHIEAHSYQKKLQTEQKQSKDQNISYKETLIDVEGNLQPKTKTTPHFLTSIEAINLSTHYLKQQTQHIYNMSDGAKFDHIPPVASTQIRTLTSTSTNATCKLTSTHFTQDDQLQAMHKITEAQHLSSTITAFKSFSLATQEDCEMLTQKLYTLIKDDEKIKQFEIYKVLDLFIENHLAVFYLFVQHNQILQAQSFLNKTILQPILQILESYIQEVSKLCKHN